MKIFKVCKCTVKAAVNDLKYNCDGDRNGNTATYMRRRRSITGCQIFAESQVWLMLVENNKIFFFC